MSLWLVHGGRYGQQENLVLDNSLAMIGFYAMSDLGNAFSHHGHRPSARKSSPSYKAWVSGIRASKLSELQQGVLQPLPRDVGDFDFTIEIDVESEEGISKRAIEQQIEETLRQLGAEVDKESDD